MRRRLIEGAIKLFDIVKLTFGERGGSVVIENDDLPIVTRDGYEVCKHFQLPNREENAGAQILVEAAEKTAEICGDGTTSTIILAGYFLKFAKKNLAAGVNPQQLNRLLEATFDQTILAIEKQSFPVTTREQMVSIAETALKGHRQVAEMIIQVIEKVGERGKITVEPGRTIDDNVELAEGFYWPYGCDLTQERRFLNPLIIVLNIPLVDSKIMANVIRQAKSSRKPLIIVGELKEGALRTFVANRNKGIIEGANVRTSREIEEMIDLSTFTACRTNYGYNFENFGNAEYAVLGPEESVIVNGMGKEDDIERRIQMLQRNLQSLNIKIEQDKVLDRISRLSGRAAKIKVGGFSKIEIDEKCRMVQNAINTVKNCKDHGLLLGFGKSLFNIELSGRDVGTLLMKTVLKSLTEQLMKNARLEYCPGLMEPELGYNLRSGKLVNLRVEQIFDSHRTIQVALTNAISVSKLLILSSCYIFSKQKGIEFNQQTFSQERTDE